MKVVVATEQRFMRYQNRMYVEGIGSYDFWRRYTAAFSSVTVIARVREVTSCPSAANRVDGDQVTVIPLPDYRGPLQGSVLLPSLVLAARNASDAQAAYIVRVPGAVGALVSWWQRRRRWPYGVEVVGDPYDSLDPAALRTSWARFFRPIAVHLLREQCKHASVACYVTHQYLQRRYPTRASFSIACSDVDLPAEAYMTRSNEAHAERPIELIFIGSLAQRYKGLHVLLDAAQELLARGVDLRLTVLGDGEYRTEYENQCKRLGLTNQVVFEGTVPSGKCVRDRLVRADLFVMPSMVEGLPRAMLEAMAVGLPCIGSSVGGIPELLSSEAMVPPGDSVALAKKILAVRANPEVMERLGQRNLETARAYDASTLSQRRAEFYQRVHDVTLSRIREG